MGLDVFVHPGASGEGILMKFGVNPSELNHWGLLFERSPVVQ